MKHRCGSIACTTAAVPPTAGQLVTSERGVCGEPLAFHYANLMSHTAFRQSSACVRIFYQLATVVTAVLTRSEEERSLGGACISPLSDLPTHASAHLS
jgi:hypothetical protein